MERTAVLLVLSGLCLLSACSSRKFIIVEKNKNWTEAQSYCRDRYTDLATVRNRQELTEFRELVRDYSLVWIWTGLHYDKTFKWFQENEVTDDPKDADYMNITVKNLDSSNLYTKTCVALSESGEWSTESCESTFQFICYNGRPDASSRFVLVIELKTWEDAQSYCRENYTDLAGVRNSTEREITKTVDSGKAWIGFYKGLCVVATRGRWVISHCSEKSFFACHYDEAPKTRKQVVRVVLKKTDSSVDMEELKGGILQKIQQELKEQGLEEDVNLRWVEKPDEKVFHKVEKGRDKEKSSDISHKTEL